MTCHEEEEIPSEVVREFDLMDGGDPTVPPQFRCEQCGGEMYPAYYKGVHGQEYKLSDVH
ncbi:putative Zn finger protein [Virgibacillus natechei]|uniref:Zn finger protein n=1 Tax=Virgibacillus natechei TaxID=1216297 RepID=A0ABS4IJY9_9BACI|nr:putative Zn finger protein [Virgibacillus natechei]